MKTNELKKGTRVMLRNGWEAILEDNMKGNTRLATVFGYCTEMGSVYSHDIVEWYDRGADLWMPVEHTEAQEKLRKRVDSFGL